MKTPISGALLIAFAAADSQGTHAGNGSIGSSSCVLPDDVSQLGKEISRLHGCVLERLWTVGNHLDCNSGSSKDGNSMVDCICKNQDELLQAIFNNTNICIDHGNKFGELAKNILASKLIRLLKFRA